MIYPRQEDIIIGKQRHTNLQSTFYSLKVSVYEDLGF
jgi:hypothetical protein